MLLLRLAQTAAEERASTFRLVERGAARQQPAADVHLELELANGERLRIGSGVDGATLRTVLDALRA